MRTPKLLMPLALAVAALALALGAAAAPPQRVGIDRIVTFGTSLSDSGNAFHWLRTPDGQGCGTPLNVPPYDQLDDLRLPEGVYATGGHHVTNGATWVEGMARELALGGNTRPAFANPGQKASNYAVGGARAWAGYPCRVNLPAQVAAYQADFGATSPATLVVIEIGANDVRDALVEATLPDGDPVAVLERALNGVAENVVALYGHGAQRFLLVNVPDIGKTPALHMLGPVAVYYAGLFSGLYNDGLLQLQSSLMQALPGADIRILDIHQALDDALAYPAAFGFTNTTDTCVTPGVPPFRCSQPDAYVFWDGIHPTRAMHAILAKQAADLVRAP